MQKRAANKCDRARSRRALRRRLLRPVGCRKAPWSSAWSRTAWNEAPCCRGGPISRAPIMVCLPILDKHKGFVVGGRKRRFTLDRSRFTWSIRDWPTEVRENLQKIRGSQIRIGPTEVAQTMRVTAEQQIHIEQLKVLGRVGVSRAERRKRQRLVLNITVWPANDLRDMEDSIQRTVDYSELCQRTKKFITERSPKLLETLANDLASYLIRTFHVRRIVVEVRKFVLKDVNHVSVTVMRTAAID